MPNSFTIDLPNLGVIREALEGESLKTVIKGFIKVASRVSADNIARDAKARLQRQLSGTSSGETVAGITVKSDRTGWGWIVDAGNVSTPMLDRWLENGTKHMKARPFFYSSAQLEEQAHFGRIQGAVQAAISQYGLGDHQ
jgi:hypothetical protein